MYFSVFYLRETWGIIGEDVKTKRLYTCKMSVVGEMFLYS